MDRFIAQIKTLRNSIPLNTNHISDIRSDYCNWVIPKRLMCGVYPWLDKPYAKSNFPLKVDACQNMSHIINDGIDTFITLQFEEPAYPRYAHFALQLNPNTQFFYFPIVSKRLPQHSIFINHMSLILDKLIEGKNVFIHCARGISRTGIYIVCILMILYGFDSKHALEYTQYSLNMRRKKEGEITCMNREFICDFEKFLKFIG